MRKSTILEYGDDGQSERERLEVVRDQNAGIGNRAWRVAGANVSQHELRRRRDALAQRENILRRKVRPALLAPARALDHEDVSTVGKRHERVAHQRIARIRDDAVGRGEAEGEALEARDVRDEPRRKFATRNLRTLTV